MLSISYSTFPTLLQEQRRIYCASINALWL